jgi:TonB-dependent receptor
MRIHQLLLFVAFFTAIQSLSAQTGRVYGIIKDGENNEPLIGATVLVVETGSGTVTDIDGSYEISLDAGTYSLEVSYTGYQPEKVTDLVIAGGENLKMDFALGTSTQVMETVVVTAEAKRNSVVNLMLLQQKSIAVVTGISSDQMKLAPDRNTSDVLKRVSGASVQDNRYVVIRGLADRYNTALINGLSLPSTEPDKRAFSFDIFPANLLDNLIIYKTATPDLPGEWAGGVVQLNTKETPDEGFATLSISTGYNSQSTFRNYQSYKGGNRDWLGFDDGTRGLPTSLQTVTKDSFNFNPSSQVKYAGAFPNDWEISEEASMRPSVGLQFSGGRSFGKLGVVGALTYSNSPKIVTGERNDFNVDKSQLYNYFDRVSRENVSVGGLLNLAYKLGSRSKIQLNNTYTISAEDQLFERTGDDIEQSRYIRSNSLFYTSNAMFSSQLLGDHVLGSRQIKLNWGLGYSRLTREIPSYRRMMYLKNYEEPAEAPYLAVVPFGNPSPNFAGNFYADQGENFYTGRLDLTYPFQIGARKGNFKLGGMWEEKDREFDARLFGFISSFQTPQELYQLPIGQIFDPKNIASNGFRMKETTDKSDSYDAGSTLYAGYGMLEQSLTSRLRFIGGARLESFHQGLNSFRILSNTPVILDTTFNDLLPSAHFIYALSDSTNLRASVSKTVARPNFRELAPFSFFDFFLFAGVDGNPNLVRTRIWNADLRYETYRKGGQYFAASLFYKRFDNPIEQFYNNAQGAGTRNFQWRNVPSAIDLGAEVEFRLKLGKVAGFLRNFMVFGNASYIYSDVDISLLPGAQERPLFGQSPYLVNAGINYDNRDLGVTSTILFNRIGRRIWVVGQDQYLHTWENPRSVVDFQVTKTLGSFGELKLTIGDILNQEAVFYQDQDDNGKYNSDQDTKIVGQRFGTNVSLGFTYNFAGRE